MSKNQKMNNDLYQYERALIKQGLDTIAGVDEVGRGPLIGPVVVACVVLPKNFKLEGLTDSKKLSEKKRECFYKIILEEALAVEVVEMSPKVIDEINIYQATKKAMIESIERVNNKLPLDHCLIDAMPLDLSIPTTSIIKGDSLSISIAAASVVAKVHRDHLMYELHEKYPNYNFIKHKGYPTKEHIEAIKNFGILPEHRKTFKPVSEFLVNQIQFDI